MNGEPLHPKGHYVLRPGDVISTIEPGGGGSGEPRERQIEAVLEDVRAGFVSVEGARRDYGVVVDLRAGPGAADRRRSGGSRCRRRTQSRGPPGPGRRRP